MTHVHSNSRYDHTGFITHSLEESIGFWEGVMGFEAQPIGVRREPWIARFMGVPGADVRLVHLFGLGTHIEFIEFVTPAGEPIRPAANQPGAAHICIRVAELEPIRAAILAKGGTLQGDTTEITEGVAKGLRGLYMRDPNGIMIELVEASI
jgi:catechol 2,3-dioxygenase-like lactoylglutathione lyase family enzyme